jgi:bacterial leucyl aminopeptidase
MFMDITDFRDLGELRAQQPKEVHFPKKLVFQDQVLPLLKDLNKSNIKSHLETFTSFHNRFFRSEYGEQSFKWLLETIEDTIKQSGADKYGVSVKPFEHSWPQSSIIATIPGRTNSTVILGAHQDSINYTDPMTMRAPGADDDGSGTVTILEVFRTLLGSQDLVEGNAENTIEFHWYSGEEAGLLGSRAVFHAYERAGHEIKAMLQQDMTGFVNLTIEAGKPVAFGLMLDACEYSLF